MTNEAVAKEGRDDQVRPVRKIGFCTVHRQLNGDNFLSGHTNTAIGDDLLMLALRAAERGGRDARRRLFPEVIGRSREGM